MKSLITILALFFLSGTINFAFAQNNQSSPDGLQQPKVDVYYFHYSRRCATCNAVEAVSKEAVEEYADKRVNFAHFNMDETAGEEKGKSLEVFGQTLLIVSTDGRIDLTNEAFMLAKSSPKKLKKLLKEKIDTLL